MNAVVNLSDIYGNILKLRDDKINIIDAAEIISKMVLSLKKKEYILDGKVFLESFDDKKLDIYKFISIHNMPEDSKNLIREYNNSCIALNSVYAISKIKGNNTEDTIKLQKEMIPRILINNTQCPKTSQKGKSYPKVKIKKMKIRYNLEEIKKELTPICEELKRMPSIDDLCRYNRYDLIKSIEKYDISEIYKLMGHKLK